MLLKLLKNAIVLDQITKHKIKPINAIVVLSTTGPTLDEFALDTPSHVLQILPSYLLDTMKEPV